ncbi:MAG: radical SAM protein [Patescibacteria group bacterium]|nr:radical SAM protein [Patescibacteria group bacterium]
MPGKKITLISLYPEKTMPIPPSALLYLATALNKNGHEAQIIYKAADDPAGVIKEVDGFKPDLIGMSVFTGFCNKKYVELSRILKERGYKIVWGNAHPALVPRQTLNEPSVDFVVIGEGEETIVDLTNKLDAPAQYYSIPGIGFKDQNGKIIINDKRNFIDMDDYLIDWTLVNLENYLFPYFSNRYKRVLSIVTSRGCPFNCQFCYNLVFNTRRWRAHDAEKIVANLQPIIEKYKVDAIRFLDDNFFVDKKRALAIVRSLGLPYSADSRVEYVDEEFVKNLKETKCLELTFGFESGSERVLREVVQKGTGTEKIIKAVTLLKNSGTIATGGIVFGLPSETKEEYWETMKFIVRLLEINRDVAFTCGWFLPYPGTGLYEKAKEKGFIPPEKVEDWDQFDRWRDDYEMIWLDWDYKQAVKYSRKIVHLLALAYKRNIPIIKNILKWRVEHLNFYWPIDIYLFSKLRNIYLFSGNNNFINRTVKKIIIKIILLKRNGQSGKNIK